MSRHRLADLGALRHRHPDRQNRAGTVLTVSRHDKAALRLDEATADRQPEPGAGALPVLRLDSVELVENPFEIAGRNARSFIDDFDRHDVAIAPGAHVDTGAKRGLIGGIIEQVEQHLLEQHGIDPQHRQIGRDLDLDAMLAQHTGGVLQRRADNVGDIE